MSAWWVGRHIYLVKENIWTLGNSTETSWQLNFSKLQPAQSVGSNLHDKQQAAPFFCPTPQIMNHSGKLNWSANYMCVLDAGVASWCCPHKLKLGIIVQHPASLSSASVITLLPHQLQVSNKKVSNKTNSFFCHSIHTCIYICLKPYIERFI